MMVMMVTKMISVSRAMIMMRKSCRRNFSLPRRGSAALKVKESTVTEAKFKGACRSDD